VKLDISVTYRGSTKPPDLRGATLRATRRALAHLHARTAGLISGVLVHRRSGRLLSALNLKLDERRSGVMGTIGIDNRAFYALFLDKGTQAHELGKGARTARQATRGRRGQRARGAFAGRRSTVMRFTVGGDTFFRARARHPGIRPRRFMLTALDQARPEIQRIFQEETAKVAQGATRG
jgi:hypothetical protein